LPTRSKRPCAAPNCPALVDSGYCPAHQKRTFGDNWRGRSNERGYDWAWQKFRERFLSKPEHAICEDCGRKVSTDVHHVKRLKEFPALRLVESNCRGLCKACHSALTAKGF